MPPPNPQSVWSEEESEAFITSPKNRPTVLGPVRLHCKGHSFALHVELFWLQQMQVACANIYYYFL